MKSEFMKIKEYIVSEISNSKWKPGFKIPSENELTKLFSVSRMTANKALRELTAEGVLVRLQGKGTFVAEQNNVSEMLEIKDIVEEIESSGKKHSFELIDLKEIFSNEEIQKIMGIKEDEILYYSVFLHYADNEPFQYEERFVNKKLVPEYINNKFENETAHRYLMKNISLTEAEHIVEAIFPNDDIANYLKIPKKTPCLCLKRRTWLKKDIVTYVKFISPGDKYKIGTRFKYSADGSAIRNSINK
jgi:GntR family histidine utilization transcriptional repressor